MIVNVILQKHMDISESKAVSIEVFWREVNQLFLLCRPCDVVCDSYESLIKIGEWFEIIDGDNLYMPFEFLSATLQNSFATNKKVLVLGILGPQNSGKTTLLNFMFGTSLSAARVRTTKGVYASVMESPIDEYDLLVILDAEGLGAESNNTEYDRKVVLFLLATCDVVIANTRDQTEDGIYSTLEMCAKSLSNLHCSKVSKPILFFVQSQRSHKYTPRQNMEDNVDYDILQGVFHLADDHFYVFPSAFHHKEITIVAGEKWQKLYSVPKFMEKVSSFTKAVFYKVRERYKESSLLGTYRPFSDLPSWLAFANDTFSNLQRFDDLTWFGDALEEKQDQFVKKWFNILVNSIVSKERKDDIFSRDHCIESVEMYFKVAVTETERLLVNMLRDQSIKPSLHSTQLANLRVIMENSRVNWLVDAHIRLENERLQLEATNGQQRINDKILEILREQKRYSREQLATLFEGCFEKGYSDIVKRRQSAEAAIRALCISIINIYKLHCSDLPNSEEIAKEIDIYKDPESQLEQQLAKMISNNYKDMLYHLPNFPDTPDFRIISEGGWVFVDQVTLSRMKQGLFDYYSELPTSKELSTQTIKDLFVEKPVTNRIISSVTKLFTTNIKCMLLSPNSRNELSPAKIAQKLVKGLNKALNSSPQLIAKLVDVRRPFDMVRSKALEVQDQLASTEMIHKCVAVVNDDIIFPCDSDLSAFGCAMTKSMRARLHMLMLQYLIAFNLQYHSKRIEQHTPLELHDNWKVTFMEQTLRGPARDSSHVESIVNRFDESLQHYCLENARKVFNNALDRFQSTATRFQLQREFDRNMESKSKEELLRYVHDPVSVIISGFEAEWKIAEAQVLEEAHLVYLAEGNSLLVLEQWVSEVHKQIESAKFSTANDIFLAAGGLGAVQALLKKEKAVVMLFCDLLRGRRVNNRYTVDGLELDVVEWIVASSSSSSKENGKHIDKLDHLIREISAIGTIFDLYSFSSGLVSQLSSIGAQLRRHECFTHTLDPDNRLQQAREKAGGCYQQCPCCNRVCDEEHWRFSDPTGTGMSRHKCRLGHQYRGMAGFAFEKTKFASLKVCGEMEDGEQVWFQDRYLLWGEFKARFPSWDFHSRLEGATTIIPQLWKTVGEELCVEYGIKYTVIDQSYSERSKHFMFVVGATKEIKSGWNSVLRAGIKFAETKQQQNPSVAHKSTCIHFSETASIVFHDEVLSEDLFTIHKLPRPLFCSEKTSFSAALKVVLGILEKHVSRVPVVIIMISDGDDAFPHRELQRMCEDEIWKKIDSFWGVGFGSKARQGTLMGMAQWMVKGYREKWHFCNPSDLSELVEQMGTIANDT